MIELEILETLAEIGGKKKLRRVSWNKREPKLDLRAWHEGDGGEEKAGKGLTLTDEEGRALLEALKKYFREG
jgi:hypothetical protein